MIRRPPRSTRTYTLFPYTTLFRSQVGQLFIAERATVAKDAQLLSVIDLSALQVEMQVPESFARDLGIGMAGEISGNGHTWKGLVSAISPEVVNGQVAARLRFDGETPKPLRQNPRLSVSVLLEIGRASSRERGWQ